LAKTFPLNKKEYASISPAERDISRPTIIGIEFDFVFILIPLFSVRLGRNRFYNPVD
jgi:hypothetical protein